MLNLYNVNNHKEGEPNKDTGSTENKTTSVTKKSDFRNYLDPSGSLSGRSLGWGIWYMKYKILLYRLLLGFLVLLSIIFWGFSLWQWTNYLVFGLTADRDNLSKLSSFTNYENINERYSAKPLQIIGVEVFRSGVRKNDAVANILNPNNNFLVRFDYYFDFGGYKTEPKRTIFLPAESRPLVYGGIEDEVISSSPNLVLENIAWERIDNHDIKDVNLWVSKHLDFSVEDFSFIRPQTDEGADAYILQFKVKNNSAFGYKDPLFHVGLFSNNTLVGVLDIVLEDLYSGETRLVDLRNFSPNLSVSSVQIYPEIDITNPEVFMEPGA